MVPFPFCSIKKTILFYYSLEYFLLLSKTSSFLFDCTTQFKKLYINFLTTKVFYTSATFEKPLKRKHFLQSSKMFIHMRWEFKYSCSIDAFKSDFILMKTKIQERTTKGTTQDTIHFLKHTLLMPRYIRSHEKCVTKCELNMLYNILSIYETDISSNFWRQRCRKVGNHDNICRQKIFSFIFAMLYTLV